MSVTFSNISKFEEFMYLRMIVCVRVYTSMDIFLNDLQYYRMNILPTLKITDALFVSGDIIE